MGTIDIDLRRKIRRTNAVNDLHQKLRGTPAPQNWEHRTDLIVELLEEAAAKLPDFDFSPGLGQGTLFGGDFR